jgi:hypothetical protein
MVRPPHLVLEQQPILFPFLNAQAPLNSCAHASRSLCRLSPPTALHSQASSRPIPASHHYAARSVQPSALPPTGRAMPSQRSHAERSPVQTVPRRPARAGRFKRRGRDARACGSIRRTGAARGAAGAHVAPRGPQRRRRRDAALGAGRAGGGCC